MLLAEDIHEREPTPLDERVRDRLAAVLLKLGLVVEQLELAGTAGHEQVDHALGPGREEARPGRQGIGAARRRLARHAGPGPARVRLRSGEGRTIVPQER